MLEKGTECLKKRNVFLVLVLIGILALVFLGVRSKQNNIMSHENVKNGFFVWMDAYVALPVKSEFDIALTYYYFEGKEQYIRKEDITAVAFEEVSNVKIKDFKVEDVECADDTYEAYTIIVTVQALEMGVNHAENVTIYADNGAQYTCPVGAWYFDVDEEDAGYVDAYSASFASTSPYKFNYNYRVEEGYSISELQYWHDKKLMGNVANEDIVIIESQAPFNYIKAKGLVESDGEVYHFYGLGSYCGIMGADISDIELSYEHNKVVQ